MVAALGLACARTSAPVLAGPSPSAQHFAHDNATTAVLALTIDDLPLGGADHGLREITEINRALVDTLRRERVPTVGFVNEKKLYRLGEVDARIAVLEGWLAAGLELGNHTYAHSDFHRVGLRVYLDDVARGETVTRLLLARRKQTPRWFRQTFLRTGKNISERDALTLALGERGYTPAPVTLENDDWYFNARYDAAHQRADSALMRRIADAYLQHWTTMFDFYEAMTLRLFHRRIAHVVLMHANRLNADHLPAVLALFRARGYTFTTLEAALADPAYRHPDRYAGKWGKSWLQRWLYTRGEDTLGREPEPPKWLQALPTK